jgi:prepilin-type N-terminal cleavage/methylation domain-containing protein
MRKHGMTMIELLGAIVLFGIILSLSAVMISVITNANAKVIEQSRASTESTLLTAKIDRELRDLGPTNYQTCLVSNCIVFIKAFEYVPNLDSGTIDLVVYDPVQTLRFEVSNGKLLINDIEYSIQHFTISPLSSLNYTIQGTTLTYSITLILTGEHNDYTFRYDKTLVLETIPT